MHRLAAMVGSDCAGFGWEEGSTSGRDGTVPLPRGQECVASMLAAKKRAKEKRGSRASTQALSPSAIFTRIYISTNCGSCSRGRQDAQRIAILGVSLPSRWVFPSAMPPPKGDSHTVTVGAPL